MSNLSMPCLTPVTIHELNMFAPDHSGHRSLSAPVNGLLLKRSLSSVCFQYSGDYEVTWCPSFGPPVLMVADELAGVKQKKVGHGRAPRSALRYGLLVDLPTCPSETILEVTGQGRGVRSQTNGPRPPALLVHECHAQWGSRVHSRRDPGARKQEEVLTATLSQYFGRGPVGRDRHDEVRRGGDGHTGEEVRAVPRLIFSIPFVVKAAHRKKVQFQTRISPPTQLAFLEFCT